MKWEEVRKIYTNTFVKLEVEENYLWMGKSMKITKIN